MKLAIMQPYFFPYIGYFQLISAVDKFVFYDDVNFIKGGWISRNKILVNGKEMVFTIPLSDISSFKPINKTNINLQLYKKWRLKLFKSLTQNYSKARYFKETIGVIEKVLVENPFKISDLAINSIKEVSNYLELPVVFEISSDDYNQTFVLDRVNRIAEICRINGCNSYINPSGGVELYNKEEFDKNGIDLYFIENNITPYAQFNYDFKGGLSIIDVLMFNSTDRIHKMLEEYDLV